MQMKLANLFGKCKHANCAIKNCAVEIKLATRRMFFCWSLA